MTAKEIISENLKYQMKNKNIAIKDLAESIGVTPQTVRRYLKEEIAPLAKRLVLISKYLNVTTDYLLGLKDEKGNIL